MATAATPQTQPVVAGSYDNIKNAYSSRSDNAISESLREQIAGALGHDPADTIHIPTDANIGEGCGNPLMIASLKEGETIVDLGSGGGFDCLLASRQVGPCGKVIGVDMTENMIARARRNAEKMGATNTEYIHARINQTTIPDNSVDCVMSNCVLNLVPDEDKLSVIAEMHRILKPSVRNVLLVDTEKKLMIFKDEDGRKFVTPGDSSGSDITSSGRKEVDYSLNEWISAFQIYGHKWTGETEQHAPKPGRTSNTNSESQYCGPKRSCC